MTQRAHTLNNVWDVGLLDWVRMQQPILNAGDVVVSGTINQGAGGSSAWKVAATRTTLTAAAPASASVGLTSAQVIASNSSRTGLAIVNLSPNVVSLGIAATAVLNKGISLTQNGVYTMDESLFSTDAINAIASGAGSAISIQEFN